jgi:hypothetical protein
VIISEKVSTFITFGYLSTTTCGMAFGLICITIAAFVTNKYILTLIIVLNVWTRFGIKRWGGSQVNA